MEAWLFQGFPVQQEQDCGASVCQAGAEPVSPALPAAAFLGGSCQLLRRGIQLFVWWFSGGIGVEEVVASPRQC